MVVSTQPSIAHNLRQVPDTRGIEKNDHPEGAFSTLLLEAARNARIRQCAYDSAKNTIFLLGIPCTPFK